MTRRDIDVYNFDKDDLDKMMLTDGVKHHERVKVVYIPTFFKYINVNYYLDRIMVIFYR